MNTVSISVIISAFNAEKTIRRCIDSILNQTFHNIEIIIINDGSTDETPTICNDYVRRDNRVIVYHQENQGTSTARRKGLELATGIYIIEIDSDDWLDSQMLSILYDKAIETNADVICCDFICEYRDRSVLGSVSPVYENGEAELNHVFGREGINCILWNKLIRASYFKDIVIPDGMRWGEDFLTTALILQKNGKVSYVPKPLYHYDLHTSDHSAVRNTNQDYIFDSRTTLIRHLHELISPKPEAWWKWMTGFLLGILLLDTGKEREASLRKLLCLILSDDRRKMWRENPKITITLLLAAYTPLSHTIIRKAISVKRLLK